MGKIVGTLIGMLVFGLLWYWFLSRRDEMKPERARRQSFYAAFTWAFFYTLFQFFFRFFLY